MANNVAVAAVVVVVVVTLTSCHSMWLVGVAASTCPCAVANNKLQQRRSKSDSRQRAVLPCSTDSNQMPPNVVMAAATREHTHILT